MINIRDAKIEDATSAIDVLRRSITELCEADHGFREAEIADWVASKTETSWGAWLARRDARVIVAQFSGDVVGVGMIDSLGKILLNYVSPNARFMGVSKAVVERLETIARQNGNQSCYLQSTKTAQQFYLGCGYCVTNAKDLTMTKTL